MKAFFPGCYEKEDGFTLVEILISLAIFTFVGFSLVAMLIKSIETTRHATRVTEASAFACEKIESFRNMPLSKILVSGTVRQPENLYAFPPNSLSGWDGEEEYEGLETRQKYKLYWNAVQDFPIRGLTSFCMEIQWEERRISRSMRFDFVKNHLF